MKLSNLKPAVGAKPRRIALDVVQVADKLQNMWPWSKGAGARKSYAIKAFFEGGQMPLQKRVLKRGFNSHFPNDTQIVNIGDLEARCEGAVTAVELEAVGLIRNAAKPVRNSWNGQID